MYAQSGVALRTLRIFWVFFCIIICSKNGYTRANDIGLIGLGRPAADEFSDPAVSRYRNLTSELAIVMTPRGLQPAETLGLSGFEFALFTTAANINENASYWTGQPGTPVLEGPLNGRTIPENLWITGMQIRKGLPLSTDVGVNLTFLNGSHLLMLGGEAKIAIHESFYRWVPALAVRGAFSQLLGTDQLDMACGELDVLASLPVGIGGMAQIVPFVGAGVFVIHVNSGVIDETPSFVTDDATDQRGGTGGSLYVFPTLDWHDHQFNRYLVGLRLNFAMMALLYQFDIAIPQFNRDKQMASHTIKLGFDT